MVPRGRRGGFEGGGDPKPQGSWLFGVVVGLAMANLAAGAVMLGTGAAIGQTMVGRAMIGKPGAPGTGKKG